MSDGYLGSLISSPSYFPASSCSKPLRSLPRNNTSLEIPHRYERCYDVFLKIQTCLPLVLPCPRTDQLISTSSRKAPRSSTLSTSLHGSSWKPPRSLLYLRLRRLGVVTETKKSCQEHTVSRSKNWRSNVPEKLGEPMGWVFFCHCPVGIQALIGSNLSLSWRWRPGVTAARVCPSNRG